MQVEKTKDQGLYNKPSAAVHPGALAAGTLPQYNTISLLLLLLLLLLLFAAVAAACHRFCLICTANALPRKVLKGLDISK